MGEVQVDKDFIYDKNKINYKSFTDYAIARQLKFSLTYFVMTSFRNGIVWNLDHNINFTPHHLRSRYSTSVQQANKIQV